MVRYIANGILVDTQLELRRPLSRKSKNSHTETDTDTDTENSEEESEKEAEEYYRELTTKVVEDEFDESGKPRVKIVYVDIMDCSPKAKAAVNRFLDDADYFDYCDDDSSPRIIVIVQDMDYWPGTEQDANALRNREWKEKTGFSKFFGDGSPGCKRMFIASYGGDCSFSSVPSDDVKFSRFKYDLWFNPKYPGAKFLLENYPESSRKIWLQYISTCSSSSSCNYQVLKRKNNNDCDASEINQNTEVIEDDEPCQDATFQMKKPPSANVVQSEDNCDQDECEDDKISHNVNQPFTGEVVNKKKNDGDTGEINQNTEVMEDDKPCQDATFQRKKPPSGNIVQFEDNWDKDECEDDKISHVVNQPLTDEVVKRKKNGDACEIGQNTEVMEDYEPCQDATFQRKKPRSATIVQTEDKCDQHECEDDKVSHDVDQPVTDQESAEAETLTKWKASIMKEQVGKKRSELEVTCYNPHLEPDLRILEKLGALIYSGLLDPSDHLASIEAQIHEAKDEDPSLKEIVDGVDRLFSTCCEEKWLDGYNQDKNLYSAGIGAYMYLKCVEQARMTANKIPALIESLINKTLAWEEEKKKFFVCRGVRLVSILEDYKLARQSKEGEKNQYMASESQKRLGGQSFENFENNILWNVGKS